MQEGRPHFKGDKREFILEINMSDCGLGTPGLGHFKFHIPVR